MRAQLNAETLQAIADATRVKYLAARSSSNLSEVYSSLSTRLVREKKLTDIAFIFAGNGALFAIKGGVLSMLWFWRVA